MITFSYRTVLLDGAHIGTIRPTYTTGKSGKRSITGYSVDLFDGRTLADRTMEGIQSAIVEQYA